MNRTTRAQGAWSAFAAALLLSACASPSDSVYFITKTSTSIVDADTVPAGISIGYDRVEGYAGPRFADGSVFPVASAIESKGEGIDRQVRQVFATGNAAKIVTRQGTADAQAAAKNDAGSAPDLQQPADKSGTSGSPGTNDKRKVVFFGTSTSVGLKMGFEATAPLPSSFTFGYKRKELAVVPVDHNRLNTSVLGSFTNGVGVAARPESPASAAASGAASAARGTARFDVQQFFATGIAAEQLAGLASISQQFQDKAEEAIGEVQKFRVQEARQGRVALDAVSCAFKLMPTQFDRVLANAEALGMFGKLGGVAAIRSFSEDKTLQQQRYFSFMRHIDADNALAGERLSLHKATLCEWAEPKK